MSTLHIFDFDDTLVSSESNVYITKASGEILTLSSEDYAKYTPEKGDRQNFKDFDKYPQNPEIIEPVFAELRSAIALDGASAVVILTARSNPGPVRAFLDANKIPKIDIVATGTSDPMAKARYVLDRVMKDDFDEVIVFEDNVRNLRTIRKELTPTGIKLKTNRVENGRISKMSESKRLRKKSTSIIGT
tara:strand:+ start:315 stop:881 length:567 start_codon:yes stop_codon:yes gene_type:complete